MYRGASLPAEHRAFFCAGRKYRVPMFLATSFSEAVARGFMVMREPPALFVIHLPPPAAGRPFVGCFHANFVSQDHLPEEEYLFTPYSVMTVLEGPQWCDDGGHWQVVLAAAADNQLDDAPGSERLPLAEWH